MFVCMNGSCSSQIPCFRTPSQHRCLQIVCTLGPACWDKETLLALIDNGMNVARLNFSHGDHEVCTPAILLCNLPRRLGDASCTPFVAASTTTPFVTCNIRCVPHTCVHVCACLWLRFSLRLTTLSGFIYLNYLAQMHGKTISTLRAACSERPGQPVQHRTSHHHRILFHRSLYMQVCSLC
jgi:hypothetical protein